MPKKIPLIGKYGSVIGNYAIVDDHLYDELMQYRWYAHKSSTSNGIYAFSKINNKSIQLHRYIMGITDPKIQIDHINHNSLDDRLNNLRICNNKQNSWNAQCHKDSKCAFKGVVITRAGRYQVEIMKDGKKYNLGTYLTAEEAAIAYDLKAIELFGEFACLNFPAKDYSIIKHPIRIRRTTNTGYKNITYEQNKYIVRKKINKYKILKRYETLEEAITELKNIEKEIKQGKYDE